MRIELSILELINEVRADEDSQYRWILIGGSVVAARGSWRDQSRGTYSCRSGTVAQGRELFE
jgi:hypothetical protein